MITLYGEFNDSTEENLKQLSKDLDTRYFETASDGKRQFMFKDLDQARALRLVSTIRRYGLSVSTEDPVSGLIKENLEALESLQKGENS